MVRGTEGNSTSVQNVEKRVHQAEEHATCVPSDRIPPPQIISTDCVHDQLLSQEADLSPVHHMRSRESKVCREPS